MLEICSIFQLYYDLNLARHIFGSGYAGLLPPFIPGAVLAKHVVTEGNTKGECKVPRPFAGIWSFYLLNDAALEKA